MLFSQNLTLVFRANLLWNYLICIFFSHVNIIYSAMTDYILNTIFKKYDAVFYIAFFFLHKSYTDKENNKWNIYYCLGQGKKNDTSVVVKRSVWLKNVCHRGTYKNFKELDKI